MKNKQNKLIKDTDLSCKTISKYLSEDHDQVRRWKYGITKMPKDVIEILKYIISTHEKVRKKWTKMKKNND